MHGVVCPCSVPSLAMPIRGTKARVLSLLSRRALSELVWYWTKC